MSQSGPGSGAGARRESLRLGVVLLAAGASTRMGRPKLLLPWGITSVLGHQLRIWQELGAEQIGVVCAPQPHPVHGELDRRRDAGLDRIINPRPENGMFSSIQSAARWAGWGPGLTHWAVVLGDQPHVPAQLLSALLEFAAQHSEQVTQPARAGRPRHPVVLPRAVFSELRACQAKTLKEFLGRHAQTLALCECQDASLDLDLDTPADYERALREFGPSPA